MGVLYNMDRMDTLNDATNSEFVDTFEALWSLGEEVKGSGWVKNGVVSETLPNGTKRTITYENWKKNGSYSEKWEGVYERMGQYKNNFRVGKWVEIRNNGSRIEGEYDNNGCQHKKWIRTDAEGNVVKKGEYEHGALKSGERVEFTF